MNRFLASLLALLFASLTISSACFAERIDAGTRLVAYDDLDLATHEGRRALDRRIEQAANSTCVDTTGPAPAGKVDATCKSDALNLARRELKNAITQQARSDAPTAGAPLHLMSLKD